MAVRKYNQTVYLTRSGWEKVQAELGELKKVRRVDVAKKISEARAMGDISENALYDSAREEQAFVEGRILELEETLKKAKIIKRNPKTDFVVIGSVVVVEVEGEADKFAIVGAPEANPAKGRISNESPVGQALLGAKVGDEVEVTTPIIRMTYKVLEIS